MLHLVLAIGVLLASIATMWMTLLLPQRGHSPLHAAPDLLKSSQRFDTSGGQEMEPKWNG